MGQPPAHKQAYTRKVFLALAYLVDKALIENQETPGRYLDLCRSDTEFSVDPGLLLLRTALNGSKAIAVNGILVGSQNDTELLRFIIKVKPTTENFIALWCIGGNVWCRN